MTQDNDGTARHLIVEQAMSASLRMLFSEMQGLNLLFHNLTAKPLTQSETDARARETDAMVEAGFDNMPV
jgi:hypothetical protein